MSDFEDSSSEEAAGDQTPAGYGKRFLGAIIDFLLVMVAGAVPTVLFFIGLVAAIDASDKGEPAAGGMMMLLGGLGWLVWLVWQVWLFGYRQGVSGTTPGKRAAGTRLTGIGTGQAPGGGVGVGRYLVPALINSLPGSTGSSTTCGRCGMTTTNGSPTRCSRPRWCSTTVRRPRPSSTRSAEYRAA